MKTVQSTRWNKDIMSTLVTKGHKQNATDIFTDKYYELVRLSREYVLYLIIDILKTSGIYRYIESDFVSVGKIIKELSFVPKAEKLISWMLSYLEAFGLLAMRKENSTHCFKISKKLPNINPGKITEAMMKIDNKVLPSNLLLEKAAKGYTEFFKGNMTGIDILFTSDKMKLWMEYFNNSNSGYVVYNSFAAAGLLKWLPDNDNIKILELGGGTGSAAVFSLKEIHNKGFTQRINEYVFSDISPVFLKVGNRAIMAELPDFQKIQLKTLDFNKPFFSQGIKNNSFDMVYGVNSVHAAEDLEKTLEYIYDVLNPGGVLILSECVRPGQKELLFQELIFNLFDNYMDIKLSDMRPMPGFLDVQSWAKILKKAKFKNIELLTNINPDGKKNIFNKEQLFAMVIKGEKSHE